MRGRSFRDRVDLEAQLRHWTDTIADPRPLRRMKGRTRLDLFAEEQPLLRPLPCHPYDTARVLYKLCDIEGFIAWDGNWYSLPYDYVTDLLPVRVTETELFVYKPDLECIAQHKLLPRRAQRRSILEGHRPRFAERGPDLDQLRVAFAAIDEKAAAFLAGLERVEPRSAGYHARKILALRERWSTTELVAALEHALAYGALEHQAVERILLARGTPRQLDEYIRQKAVEKHGTGSGPRDLSEYDALPVSKTQPTAGEPPCPSEAKKDPETNSGSGSTDT